MSLGSDFSVMAERPIMIVDDDPSVRDILKTILHSKGFDVIEAVNGFEALEKISLRKPKIIILDIMLPGMNGFEICERLKLNPKTVNIPVLFLTCKGEASDLNRAMNLGAMDYFLKPFSPQQVLEKVLEILQLD